MTEVIYVLWGICAAILIPVCIVLYRTKAKKNALRVNYAKRYNPFTYVLYHFLANNIFTRKYYGKVKKKYAQLYPSDENSITRRVNRIFLTAILSGAAALALFIWMADGDVFYICLDIWIVLVLVTFIIDWSFSRLEDKQLLQFGDFLTDTRHYYHETNMIDSAIYMTLSDLPAEVGLHAEKIYEMTASPETVQEVDKYAKSRPNRFFMTFAAICASIKEYGDKVIEGSRLFLINVNYLKEELIIEITKRKRNNYLFSGLVFIVLSPVFFLKPIEAWMQTNMPEIKSYYEGAYGTLSCIATFIASFAAYQMIGSLKDGKVDELQEHKTLQNLARVPVIQSILVKIENRNYSKTLRIGDDLKMTGDKTGTRAFLLKRILFALAFFILFNILSFIVVEKQSHDLMTNFEKAFENSIVPNEDYRLTLEETAREYAGSYKYMSDQTYEEMCEELAKKISVTNSLKPVYAREVAKVVTDRYLEDQNVYYTWWMLLLSFGAAGIGYAIPLGLLKYRISVMKMSMDDEVAQFRTLMLILMHEDGVTIDVILEWLERFSFCFKDSIQKCIANLEQDQQRQLQILKDSESFPAFRRFVDNLLAVDKAGVVGAFDEIKTEREFYKQTRQEDNIRISEKKASIGRTIAFIPFIVVLMGHLIVPFAFYAIKMFGSIAEVMQ